MSLVEILDVNIEERMKKFREVSYDLETKLEENIAPDKVWEEFNGKVDNFNNFMPVISAVSSTAMKDRHWKEIFNKLNNINYIPEKTLQELTLGDLIDKTSIMSHIEDVSSIASAAQAQERIMKDMDKIEKDWSTMKFQVVLQNKMLRDKFIIATVEEIMNLLEEHIQLY